MVIAPGVVHEVSKSFHQGFQPEGTYHELQVSHVSMGTDRGEKSEQQWLKPMYIPKKTKSQ